MTVEHIVFIEANEGQSEQVAQELLDGIAGLKGKIPGVLDVKLGANFTNRAPGVTHAAVVTLEDKEALAGYGPHPDHKEVLKLLLPFAKNVTVVDIEI